jgi:two-component system sensor histidine kinase/response regulator
MNTRSREVVLIVDDQPENIKVVGTVLSLFDYDIVAATSGEQAFKRLEARLPDLILLDMMMPEMDGLAVCRKLKENPAWSDIPVIFLSAADDKNLIVQALECGGVDYVTKPFNRAELLSRVRTHLALKEARDRLRRLDEDKDEILGMLAHDLKNGLAGIRLSAGLMSDRGEELPERCLTLARNIEGTSDRLLDHIAEFLANLRSEQVSLKAAPVDFGAVAAEAVALNMPAATAKRIDLALDATAPGKISVMADPDGLVQALDNLVSNAVKFTPPGGKVLVSVPPPHLGFAQCRVEDSGPGFTDEDRAKLFRRYQRLSARPTASEPSTGLGLSIAARIVDRLKGELRLEESASPLGGAAFTLRVPLAVAPPVSEPAA